MGSAVRYDEVEVGTELPEQTFALERLTLIQYAGASGDFNPIHWNERFATSVGLPDVIAHGMLTMAEAVRVVTDWVGDPGAVVEYGVRFTRPVVVLDEGGGRLTVSGVVTDKRDADQVVVTLTARSGAEKVLAQARAVVRLG
jgi:acyl dehydratase